jgi:hypothetical protein
LAIDHVVKQRDRLVVERLRLFRLKRAIDAYARTVDSQLQECVEAGRELGAKIALPIWENVWKTSLQEEMRRVSASSVALNTVETGLGPLRASDVVVRLRHLATVLRLRPSRAARALFVSKLS